jgi:hypothetical protein
MDLVAQHEGVQVLGHYDKTLDARVMVSLPPLTTAQLRRPVYFFGAKKTFDLTMKQTHDPGHNKLKQLEGEQTVHHVAPLRLRFPLHAYV